MLEPAVCYKDDIFENFKQYYYTDDLFYYNGNLGCWLPGIEEESEEGHYDFAIVDNGICIGYFSYQVDFYSSNVYNFGLFSFDRGNPIVGLDVFEEIEELICTFHRVSWRMVGGNPIEKNYDKLCKKYNGKKYVLEDVMKDRYGNYHDEVIYEIIDGEN